VLTKLYSYLNLYGSTLAELTVKLSTKSTSKISPTMDET
jgi:predicted secreted Zn-dependent protease